MSLMQSGAPLLEKLLGLECEESDLELARARAGDDLERSHFDKLLRAKRREKASIFGALAELTRCS